MDKLVYTLVTLAESALAVFGVRALFEEPRYTVVERLDRGVEIRAYDPRLAYETDARSQGDGAAFGRLFRTITGANRAGDRIARAAPVQAGPVQTIPAQTEGQLIAMTVPVEQGGGGTMRFFLPRAVAEAGAPEPTEAGVRLVRLPAERMAVLRFTGGTAPEARAERQRVLDAVLRVRGLSWEGPPVFMGYDPPFSIPFLRRNEVAVRLGRPSPEGTEADR